MELSHTGYNYLKIAHWKVTLVFQEQWTSWTAMSPLKTVALKITRDWLWEEKVACYDENRICYSNSKFLQTRLKQPCNGIQNVSRYGCFLRSESAGPVTIESSSFAASVNREFYDPLFEAIKSSSPKIDSSSTLRCPSGSRIKREIITQTAGFELIKDRDVFWINVK